VRSALGLWAEALEELAVRSVPTLIIHRSGDRVAQIGAARHMEQHIPGAKLVELPGDDHAYTLGDQDSIIDEIEEFLTGIRHTAQPDRVLATVLFTDIVDSTNRAAELGDRRWLLAARQSRPPGAKTARPVRRQGDQAHRGRIPRDLHGSEPGHRLCLCHPR
jgi:hypothetical protein